MPFLKPFIDRVNRRRCRRARAANRAKLWENSFLPKKPNQPVVVCMKQCIHAVVAFVFGLKQPHVQTAETPCGSLAEKPFSNLTAHALTCKLVKKLLLTPAFVIFLLALKLIFAWLVIFMLFRFVALLPQSDGRSLASAPTSNSFLLLRSPLPPRTIEHFEKSLPESPIAILSPVRHMVATSLAFASVWFAHLSFLLFALEALNAIAKRRSTLEKDATIFFAIILMRVSETAEFYCQR